MSFFKTFFASFLGIVIGLATLVGITFIVLSIFGALSGNNNGIAANSVLKISLTQAVPELSDNNGSSGTDAFSLDNTSTPGLRAILKALEFAKTDDKIKGIYLDLAPVTMGAATRSALRGGLLDFKKSGKFIVAYSTHYSQGSYYLASVADKVYLHPKGMLDWAGVAAQIPFFKVMFDKVGIKMQVYYAGKFKSATEPFRRSEMSPENKLQVREYLEANYQMLLQDIAVSRKIPYENLRAWANDYAIRTGNDALSRKMVDGLRYKDEVLTELRTRLSLEKKDKIPVVTLGEYVAAHPEDNGSGRAKIAVVYAEGDINDGRSEGGAIGGDTYSELIRKLREDEDVKAIVLRINSGGGSSLASEIIWRELQLCRNEGKTVVVSMGDVAASGGYYIACNANSIVAEPNTITGSIGVFGLIPNAGGLMRDKLGVTFDTLKTGKYSVAASGNVYFEFNAEEGNIIQAMVDTTYSDFLGRVAAGRKMTKAQVDSIAQGRVWTGRKALQLGLVDTLGNLQTALHIAAKTAKLNKYKIVHYPETESPLQRLLHNLQPNATKVSQTMLREQLGEELYQQYLLVQKVRMMKGVQMRFFNYE
jgi:protease IV